MQNKQYKTDCRFKLHFFVILSTIVFSQNPHKHLSEQFWATWPTSYT